MHWYLEILNATPTVSMTSAIGRLPPLDSMLQRPRSTGRAPHTGPTRASRGGFGNGDARACGRRRRPLCRAMSRMEVVAGHNCEPA